MVMLIARIGMTVCVRKRMKRCQDQESAERYAVFQRCPNLYLPAGEQMRHAL